MNNSLKHTFKFAALMTLAGATVMQAETFHLPVAAHWGETMLQAGDYKMSLPDAALGRFWFKIEGADKTVYVLPVGVGEAKVSNFRHLDLKEVNGEYFVSRFSPGDSVNEFIFQTPKPTARRVNAKRTVKGDESVSAGGN